MESARRTARAPTVHDAVRFCAYEILYAIRHYTLRHAAAELIHAVVPLPIPASIYGLVIMLLCLNFKLIRLEWVEQAADILVGTMTLMFVPAAVGLMSVWGDVQAMLLPLIIIILVTTVLTFAASGLTAQSVMRRRRGK
jgi:holin-like protein